MVDLLVGWKGINYMFEVKGPSGVLTPKQIVFHDEWLGTIFTVRTLDEALETLGII